MPDPDHHPTGANLSFEVFVERYAPRLRRFFAGRGMERARAEELAERVMCEVWDWYAHTGPNDAEVATRLFALARNRFVSDYTGQRRPEPDLEDPSFHAGDSSSTKPQEGDRTRRGEALADRLTQLPTEHATVLRLLYYDGLDMATIAEALEVPLDTVKSRARQALQALRGHAREGAP